MPDKEKHPLYPGADLEFEGKALLDAVKDKLTTPVGTPHQDLLGPQTVKELHSVVKALEAKVSELRDNLKEVVDYLEAQAKGNKAKVQ